jgi:ketol-acid reductoisomerase
MTAKMYYDADVSLAPLEHKLVAIIGYGSQAHAHAQNLRDSGVNVVVGLREGSSSRAKAEAAGLRVDTIEKATQDADLIMMLIPDENIADTYKESVEPYLTEGKYLGFGHGFNIHFKQVVPPANVNVFLVAPKGPGHMLRRVYVEGAGMPGIFAIEQAVSSDAREVVMAYARGIGCTRAGVLETTFKEETETDLFGEQAVLCGGLTSLIKNGFEVLTNAGYQPEIAYFEVLHECKLIIDLIYEKGFAGMRHSISNTAEYGDYLTGPKVIGAESRKAMEDALEYIQNGGFAAEFVADGRGGRPKMNAWRQAAADHPLEDVGRRLRDMMPFISKKALEV